MATEHIPQIDNLIKDFGKRLREDVKQASKEIEQAIKELKKYQESEEKSMLHNVTVREDKVLEEYWVIRAVKEDYNNVKKVVGEMECTNKPTLNEIAAFLKNSGGDFVSVVQNYRFASELPF